METRVNTAASTSMRSSASTGLNAAPKFHYTVTKLGTILSGAVANRYYYPQIVDMRSHPTFPYDWAIYASADHALSNGDTPGIFMFVADGDPSVPANWISYTTAVGNGGFASYGSKPAANPIFAYTDEGSGDSETPHYQRIGSTDFLTLHNAGFTGSKQKTCIASSTDGVNFTGYKTHTGGTSAVILDPVTDPASGDHTGYFVWNLNPFSGVAYTYVGYSSWRANGESRGMQWGSNDGINWTKIAVTENRRFAANFPIGYQMSNRPSNPSLARALPDGTYAWVWSVGTANAYNTGAFENWSYEVIVAADGVTLLKAGRRIVEQGGIGSADEKSAHFINAGVEYNGSLIVAYQAADHLDDTRLGLMRVDFSTTAPALPDITPGAVGTAYYDTELAQDFRGGSSFTSGLSSQGSAGATTWGAGGVTITATAGNYRSVARSTALTVANYSMIELMVYGATFSASNITLGLCSAQYGAPTDGVMVRSINSQRLATLRTMAGNVTLQEEIDKASSYIGANAKLSYGIRYYPQRRIVQYLGANREVCWQWDASLMTATTLYPQYNVGNATVTATIEQMVIRTKA